MGWSDRGVVDVCGRWLNIIEFHEISSKNRCDGCIMDERVRMGIGFPFISHVLSPEVSGFWVLKIWPVNNENCGEHVCFVFWHPI